MKRSNIPGIALAIAVLMGASLITTGAAADSTTADTTEEQLFSETDDGYLLFGSYEQDGDTSNGAEPIEWIVLEENGDEKLLVSRYILDSMVYNKEDAPTTWETSALREWINTEFFNSAFNEAEQERVLTSHVTNADNAYFGVSGGNDTDDKVYILDAGEIKKYFNYNYYRDEGMYGFGMDLITEATKYARSRGSDNYSPDGDLFFIYETYGYTSDFLNMSGTIWWERTPGYSPYAANVVWDDGFFGDGGNEDHDSFEVTASCGVRPVIRVNTEVITPIPTEEPTPSPKEPEPETVDTSEPAEDINAVEEKSNLSTILLIIGGALVALSGAFFVGKKAIKPKTKSNGIGNAGPERPKIELEKKAILLCQADGANIDDFKKFLDGKLFLNSESKEYDSVEKLKEIISDNKSDEIIVHIDSDDELTAFDELLSNYEGDDKFALLVDDSVLTKGKNKLETLKKEKRIVSYVGSALSNEIKLIKLILPLYKPELNGENALGLIGSVSDALGIPYVSKVIDTALSGKEVVETVREGDLDVKSISSVVSEISGVLGYDKVGEVANLIRDLK